MHQVHKPRIALNVIDSVQYVDIERKKKGGFPFIGLNIHSLAPWNETLL